MTTTNIVGIQTNKILEGKRNLIRETLGLERIIQEYYVKTADLPFLSTYVLFNGNTFPQVYKYTASYAENPIQSLVTDAPPNTPGYGYPYMTIERVDYETLEGGITRALTTYSGLFSIGNPKPEISFIPTQLFTPDWLHNKFFVSIKFIAYFGEPGSDYEAKIISNRFGTSPFGETSLIIVPPKKINEYNIPTSKVAPYYLPYSAFTNAYGNSANISWTRGCFGICETNNLIDPGPPEIREKMKYEGYMQYFGLCITSFTATRVGLFGIFEMQLKDLANFYGYNGATVQGVEICNSCFNTLNYVL